MYTYIVLTLCNTVNSRLADTPLLRTLAIMDKIQISIYKVWLKMTPGIKDSRYSGHKRRPEGVRYNKSWLYCQQNTWTKIN